MKDFVIRYLTDRYLRAVTVDDLLRFEGTKLFIGKKELNEEEKLILKSESESMKSSLVWKLITENVYWISNFKMLKGSSEEVTFGRAMIYDIEVIQEFIEKLRLLK